MNPLPPDDPIVRALQRVRQRQIAPALAELEALTPDLDSPQGVALEGCRLLLRWYARPVSLHYEVGLAGAITGLSVLQGEGYRPLIASRAQHIVVQCRYEAAQQQLSIRVRDDGQGIPSATLGQMSAEPAPLTSSGKGLQNLVQRARRLGGQLHFKGLSPGTEVAFELPLPPGPPPPQEPLT